MASLASPWCPPGFMCVTFCSQCIKELDLKVNAPCLLHPKSIQEEKVTLPWQIRRFVYEEALSGDTIRLLKLKPGQDDQPIQCDMIVRSLDSKPVYTALSYTWGDQTIKYEISCDGQPLYIGENLYSALWQIRQDNRADSLWVDAICINQKNTTEKTAQVRTMRQIYENANLVLCWLGKQEASDKDGFALMQDIFTSFGDISLSELMMPSFQTTEELGLPGIFDPRWAALCKILYRPYFFRIWIIQEIIVGKNCTIQCGTYSLDRVVIFAIGAAIERFHYIKENIAANIPIPFSESTDLTMNARGLSSIVSMSGDIALSCSLHHLWALKNMVDDNIDLKICQLLITSRVFKATEPRDRFFALVGFCSDVDNIFIDYNKSIEDIQLEIAKCCMLNPNSWGCMTFSYVDRKHHSQHLPSWVPDWTSGGPIHAPLAGSYYAYRVGNTPVPNWEFLPNNQISLIGTIFDQVSTIIHETPYMRSVVTLPRIRELACHCRRMEDWENSCWELAATLRRYPTGQKLLEAYWRTLIFNRINIDQEPTQEYELAFKNWNTGFANAKDLDSFSNLEETSAEPIPPAATIWEKIERLVNQIFTVWQRIRLASKLGLLSRLQRDAAPFERAFPRYSSERKFCTTASGFMGWVPSAALEGDLLCFFEDCQLPFVVRSCEGGYEMIGDAYVHGIMDFGISLPFFGREIVLV